MSHKYAVLMIVSIFCLIGTMFTNIQQFAQFSQLKERTEKYENEYQKNRLLYEFGVIEEEPIHPGRILETAGGINTPYNCLNIPVSIIFWTLSFVSVITAILVWNLKINCTKSQSIKLYVLSGVALCSSLVGLIYWALNFHW